MTRANRKLLSVDDLSDAEIQAILNTASRLKAGSISDSILNGKNIALLFDKESFESRISFEGAIRNLGGSPIYLSQAEVVLGKREAIKDVARVLSRYVDGVVACVYKREDLDEFAKYATVPVINALFDEGDKLQLPGDSLTNRLYIQMAAFYLTYGNNELK